MWIIWGYLTSFYQIRQLFKGKNRANFRQESDLSVDERAKIWYSALTRESGFFCCPGFVSWKTSSMNYKRIQNTLERLFIIIKSSPIEAGIIAIMLILLCYATFLGEVHADAPAVSNSVKQATALQVKAIQNSLADFGTLPVASYRGPDYSMEVAVTAYNSVPWQTDDTPCIGAQGTDICAFLEAGYNTCAANFVPLGTVIEVDGLGLCTVRDRMNARYWYRVDWYMGMDIESAKQFGLKVLDVDVYASNS